jgi:hypothetical protein
VPYAGSQSIVARRGAKVRSVGVLATRESTCPLTTLEIGALCSAVFCCVDAPMRTFLRLVQRDDRRQLLLTLCDEHGNEIDSATAPDGDAAIDRAIRLLARTQTLRPGYRLTVSMESDGAQR